MPVVATAEKASTTSGIPAGRRHDRTDPDTRRGPVRICPDARRADEPSATPGSGRQLYVQFPVPDGVTDEFGGRSLSLRRQIDQLEDEMPLMQEGRR
jgi:hypothetical protein